MNSRIKLGPLAIFLAIITIILTMLALLGHVTSNADVVLAERYAEVTEIKYELEKQGSSFLAELDEQLKSGKDAGQVPGVTDNGDYYTHTEGKGEYTLTVDFSVDNGKYTVKRWRINKNWEEQNIFDNILH